MSENKSNSNGNDSQDPQRLSDEEVTAPGVTGQAPINADPVAEAKAEAEKYKNEYLYLRAEFENHKRQAIKERSDMRKYGAERMVSDLLGVLDIFETALATEVTAENFETFRKGIDMTANELRSVLQRHGVTEVHSHGKPFDPQVHEALSSEETEHHPPGTVTQVYKKPYRLHDKVVRPGQVVVAKPKS